MANYSTDPIYYVYALSDPRTNMPFYIGKGKRYKSNNERSRVHLTPGHAGNKQKVARIAEIRNLGFEPVIEYLFKNLDEKTAYEHEVALIKKYGKMSNGGSLTNMATDRRPPGMLGKKFSEETKRRWSIVRTGKKASNETKHKMSIARIGEKNNNALTWEITLPTGEIVQVKGLSNWCRENNLNYHKIYNNQVPGFDVKKFGTGKGGPGWKRQA